MNILTNKLIMIGLGLLFVSISNFAQPIKFEFPPIYLVIEKDVVHHVLRDLGIAIWISLVVSLGIEKISHRERNKEISEILTTTKADLEILFRNKSDQIGKDYFMAMLGKEMPLSYREEMLAYHTNMNFFAKNTSIVMRIENFEDDFVKINIDFSYLVYNCSGSKQEYPDSIFFERPSWIPDTMLNEFRVNSWSIGANNLNKSELITVNKSKKDDSGDVVFNFPRKIIVEPGQYINFKIEAICIRSSSDTFVFSRKGPSDGINIFVTAPDDYKVQTREIRLKNSTEPHIISNNGGCEIAVTGHLMPLSSFVIRWSKVVP